MVFYEETARNYDRWLNTPQGQYIKGREKDLILNLTAPRRGETLLAVGCGTGEHLLLFKNTGCQLTCIDSSPLMLEAARQKLGGKGELLSGRAEDLPFSDNEFEVVCLILSLEFSSDPEKAISEAIRVSRGRVFLGVLNRYSISAAQRKVIGLFVPSVYRSASFFHAYELTGMVRRLLPGVRIQWGSVIFLPDCCYSFAVGLEEFIPAMKNPFGAFLGLSFSVTYNIRTVQDIIGEPFKLKREGGQPAQGIVREGNLDQGSLTLRENR